MFFGGYETSSSTIAYCLYELAFEPEIQGKLHEEIDEVLKTQDGLNYENIVGMKYLDMVFYGKPRI